MKKLIIALSLVLSAQSMAGEITKADICASYSSLAGVVMMKRQEGVDMARMIAALNGGDSYDTSLIIIKAAYALPRFSTPDYQQNAIIDFKNDVMSECMGR